VPFGHEAADKVGLERAKFDVETSGDEVVEVVGGKINEELSGVVPTPIEVEVETIEDDGEDIGDKDEELEDARVDK